MARETRQQIGLEVKDVDYPQNERVVLRDALQHLGAVDSLLHGDHHIIIMADAEAALTICLIQLRRITRQRGIAVLQADAAPFTIFCHHIPPF